MTFSPPAVTTLIYFMSPVARQLADVRDQMDLVLHYLPEAGTVYLVALHKYLVINLKG